MDLRTRHEENSSVSFFSSIVRIFSFLRNRIRQKINARKNILNIAWYTSCQRFVLQMMSVILLDCNTRSSGFSTSQDKDTAAPFDHADRRYVVDGIRVVLSFRLHQQEDHFEQLAPCVLEERKSAISL